jgi:hypothetical protein
MTVMYLLVHSSACVGTSEFKKGLSRAAGAVIDEKTLGSLIIATRLLFVSAGLSCAMSLKKGRLSGMSIAESGFDKPEAVLCELRRELLRDWDMVNIRCRD